MSNDTVRELRKIAQSLQDMVDLLRGNRKGVLTEPARVILTAEGVSAVADAVSPLLIEEDN